MNDVSMVTCEACGRDWNSAVLTRCPGCAPSARTPPTFSATPATANSASHAADAAILDPGIPPGWYPDPQALPCDRYWDGDDWTERTRPQAPRRPAPTLPASPRNPKPDGGHPREVAPGKRQRGRGYWRTYLSTWLWALVGGVVVTAVVGLVRAQGGPQLGLPDLIDGLLFGLYWGSLANFLVALVVWRRS